MRLWEQLNFWTDHHGKKCNRTVWTKLRICQRSAKPMWHYEHYRCENEAFSNQLLLLSTVCFRVLTKRSWLIQCKTTKLFKIKLQDFSERQGYEKQQASYISYCQYDTMLYSKSIMQIFFYWSFCITNSELHTELNLEPENFKHSHAETVRAQQVTRAGQTAVKLAE